MWEEKWSEDREGEENSDTEIYAPIEGIYNDAERAESMGTPSTQIAPVQDQGVNKGLASLRLFDVKDEFTCWPKLEMLAAN